MPRRRQLNRVIRRLALFRYRLRRFLRFSEKAVRSFGITPSQHQLLLGIAGYCSKDRATISDLAEFLQQRHNTVVRLVDRAQARGLVRRERSTEDRRVVSVRLTRKGVDALRKLSALHIEEMGRIKMRVEDPDA